MFENCSSLRDNAVVPERCVDKSTYFVQLHRLEGGCFASHAAFGVVCQRLLLSFLLLLLSLSSLLVVVCVCVCVCVFGLCMAK